MTPVLIGRWQTRSFMMLVFGIPISLLFGIAWGTPLIPVLALLYVLDIGLVLDVIWDWVQRRRWENDFPPVLHVATGAIEGTVFWLLLQSIGLPFIPASLPFARFLLHYCTVFFVIFCVLWGLMKVLFPWWRFQGGRLSLSANMN
ncbi:MAG: hypothetical protein AAFR67_12965 [Chloroflexota bacterium]